MVICRTTETCKFYPAVSVSKAQLLEIPGQEPYPTGKDFDVLTRFRYTRGRALLVAEEVVRNGGSTPSRDKYLYDLAVGIEPEV